MTNAQALLVAAVIIGIDAIIVPAIIHALIAGNWSPIADAFPPVGAPRSDAPRWNFASMKVGMLNLGWSVHLVADETHLHMIPAKVLRWLGMKPASVPWEKIEYIRDKGRRWSIVKIGSDELLGPREPFALAKR